MERFVTAAVLVLASALPAAAQDDPRAHGYYMSPVEQFQATDIETTRITLAWAARHVQGIYDGYLGPADTYELRTSTNPADAFDAMAVADAALPPPGNDYDPQSATVEGLTHDTTHYFILRTHFISRIDGYDCVVDSAKIGATTAADYAAPGVIDDLAAESATAGSVTLTWTAAGDDGSSGLATDHDLRLSTAGPITTSQQFDAAARVAGLPVPAAPGSAQSMEVGTLAPGTGYWFAIRALDEVGNPGPLSANSPSAMTLPGGGSDNSGGPSCGAAADRGGSAGGGLRMAVLTLALGLVRR